MSDDMAERDSAQDDRGAQASASSKAADELETAGSFSDGVSRFLVIAGFVSILLAGLCFYLFRNHPLQYDDFAIDANQLGKYLLIAGVVMYFAGRVLFYQRRLSKGRKRGT